MSYAREITLEAKKDVKKFKSLIYRPPVPKKLSVVRCTYRGRSGKVHKFTKKEIATYVERRRL